MRKELASSAISLIHDDQNKYIQLRNKENVNKDWYRRVHNRHGATRTRDTAIQAVN
jgi:hypothetical protein